MQGTFEHLYAKFSVQSAIHYTLDKLCDFRKFHDFTVELSQAELSKIIRMTNCKIPCNYNEYKLANNPPRPFTDSFGNETVFGLLAVSENTEYQEEVLLYPPSKSENIIQSIKFTL